jgi:hypothetical protein
MPKIDDVLKADVVKWSAFYEHRIRNGSVRISASSRLPADIDSSTESYLPPRGLCCKVHAAV